MRKLARTRRQRIMPYDEHLIYKDEGKTFTLLKTIKQTKLDALSA